MARYLFFIVLAGVYSGNTQAELNPNFWVETSASTASLRIGGAKLVSSDSLAMDKEYIALITYWEVPRQPKDSEFYRCVDVQTVAFIQVKQTCWSVLTAADGVK